MRIRSTLPAAALAALLLTGIAATPATAATGGQLDVVLTDATGRVDPNLGAGLYLDGVGADGRRSATKVAACIPNFTEGVCTFTGVAPGRYIVESGAWQEGDGTTKTFYRAGTPGTIDGFQATAITIRDDSYTEIAIRRQKGVTITGRITQNGAPAVSVGVRGITSSPLADDPTPRTTLEFTGADGDYALTGLAGTDYRVVATPDRSQGHVPTWFGGALDEARATAVRGAAGETKRADIAVRRATRLTVPVKSLLPAALTAFRRVEVDGVPTWEPAAKVETTATGRYMIELNLPEGGVYRLRFVTFDGARTVWWNQAGTLSSADDLHVATGTDTEAPAELDLDLGAQSRAVSATTLTAPATASAGAPIKVSAAVTGTGPATGRGTVQIFEGDRLLGTHSVDNAGTFPVSLDALPAGTHQLTAYFTGNRAVRASYSAAVTVTVKAPATVAAKPAAALRAGTKGKITVAVKAAGVTPTGTVLVKYGTTKIGAAKLTTAGKGRVNVTIKGLRAGTRTLTIVYGGSSTVEAKTIKIKVAVR